MPDHDVTRIELSALLPHAPADRDPCVQRLVRSLKAREGIADAHPKTEPGQAPQLCIHFDRRRLSLQRVRELAHIAGAELSARYGHKSGRAAAMHARAARTLGARLEALPGVLEADVAPSGAWRLEFDTTLAQAEAIDAALAHADLVEVPDAASKPARTDHADHDGHDHDHAPGKDHAEGAQAHDHAHGGLFGERSELIFALLAGALTLTGWGLGRLGWIGEVATTALYVGAYVFGGYYTLREALENLRARRFEIDTLMLVAAAGAAALGKWGEGALLLFLFSLGHSLEHYAMGRARRAIEALAKLAPDTAHLKKGDRTEDVGIEQLQPGDVVVVKPNERLPADGVVVEGESAVNQAPVTGESVPVDKRPVADAQAALQAFDRVPAAHRVFAGTINGSGALEVMVARRAGESTMARVVKLVTEAEAQRSPTQHFTEKFERLFVPAVLGLVGLLMFAWVVVDEPFAVSFYRAMAVLVAASPCALAISVPSAVLSGVARAGRSGVLVKGGAPLENLGTLTAIAFDKTGTLTEGKPRLTDAVPAPGVAEAELLSVALAVEQHSDHPLASAIVAGARERLGEAHRPPTAEGIEAITGRGVRARVGGAEVHIGKPVLFDEIAGAALPEAVRSENARLVDSGRTTMIVRHGDRVLGVIGVMDTPRPAASGVMRALKEMGIERLIMISGDNQRVADSVAASVGLTEARGDLMPDDKVKAIEALRGDAGRVAMVGDGVNDAPAMANATVGIAMGAAGSDVALETADVALMADDLSQLPLAVGLSRATSRVIRQNLWVSLGVVAVLIPATIFGLGIGTAVIFHEGSTLLVVVNALRLLAYQQPK
jgi:Cd2+/Zn2+-exporting ATPase